MRINARGFTEVADLVGKADLERMPAVVDILDHFGGFEICPNEGGVEFRVQGGKQLTALVIELADYRFWGRIEIHHCRALAQKFRIVADAEVRAGFLFGMFL